MAYLNFKVFFIGGEQQPSLAAFLDGIHQLQYLLGKPIIRLGLSQHLLVQGKVEHFYPRSRRFKSAVIEQDAERSRLKFGQGQRDTVEFLGNNIGIIFLLGHKGHGTEYVEPADIVVILPFLRFFEPNFPFPHLGKSLFIWYRLTEIIPLHFFATDIPKIAVLFLCLHALHQRVDINALRHFHDGGGDTFCPRVKGPEETHIQLNLVEGKLFQSIQGGISAAKIVHPNLIAGRPEPVHDALKQFQVFGYDAFGNFKVNVFMRNLVLADDHIRHGKDVTESKIKPGQVHRNRNGSFSVVNFIPDHFAHLSENVRIQLMDHPFLFQYGNELIGIYHAQLRVDPPGQRLKTAQLPG